MKTWLYHNDKIKTDLYSIAIWIYKYEPKSEAGFQDECYSHNKHWDDLVENILYKFMYYNKAPEYEKKKKK